MVKMWTFEPFGFSVRFRTGHRHAPLRRATAASAMRAALPLLLLSLAAAPAAAFTFPALATPGLRRQAAAGAGARCVSAPALRHGILGALPQSAATQLSVRGALHSRSGRGALLRMDAGGYGPWSTSPGIRRPIPRHSVPEPASLIPEAYKLTSKPHGTTTSRPRPSPLCVALTSRTPK